jgi:hypothetical protein
MNFPLTGEYCNAVSPETIEAYHAIFKPFLNAAGCARRSIWHNSAHIHGKREGTM